MWAQMISVRVKDGAQGEIVRIMELLRGIEQPDSGLLRQLVFQDQADPQLIRTIAVFESEDKARARESDARRREVLSEVQAAMSQAIASPPEFANLDVVWEMAY